jgi:hypothetical protein
MLTSASLRIIETLGRRLAKMSGPFSERGYNRAPKIVLVCEIKVALALRL